MKTFIPLRLSWDKSLGIRALRAGKAERLSTIVSSPSAFAIATALLLGSALKEHSQNPILDIGKKTFLFIFAQFSISAPEQQPHA